MASEAFAWQIFGRRKQKDCPDPDPKRHFLRLVDATMPHGRELLAVRYSVEAILTERNYNLDLSFVEMQWRYVALQGREVHPAGLHEWPLGGPPDGEGLAGPPQSPPLPPPADSPPHSPQEEKEELA